VPPPATKSLNGIGFGLVLALMGGFLFTFDLPLLRLAETDKWTMIVGRGVLLFLAISFTWLTLRVLRNDDTPFIAGKAGWAVIGTNTIANIALIAGASETKIANVAFILALTPLLTAVFARIFLKEEVKLFTWLATLLALVGVGIIMKDGLSSGGIVGDLLAALCSVCTAAAFTIIRGSRKNVANSLAMGSLTSAIVVLIFFPVSLHTLNEAAGFGLPAWFWLVMNGIVVIPLASVLIATGPRYLPSVDVSMFFLLETVLAPIWVWMIFGEQPSRMVLIGGTIVIVTLIVHSIWRMVTSWPRQGMAKTA
jgi:drug/metabolite transporter (DMT)-like permease